MAFGSRSYGSSGYAQQNGATPATHTRPGRAATVLLNLFNRHVLRNKREAGPALTRENHARLESDTRRTGLLSRIKTFARLGTLVKRTPLRNTASDARLRVNRNTTALSTKGATILQTTPNKTPLNNESPNSHN